MGRDPYVTLLRARLWHRVHVACTVLLCLALLVVVGLAAAGWLRVGPVVAPPDETPDVPVRKDNDTGGRYMYRSSKAALNAAWRSLAVDHPALVAFVLHPGWVRTDMGGPSAEVAVEASIQGMRRVIDAAGPDSRGRFLTWDGKELPW